MGNWEMVRLGDVLDEVITGEWGTACAAGKVGTKVLRTTNFTNLGIINYDNAIERSIPANKIEKKKLKRYDIILEKSGGSDNQPVGRVVFFDNETDDVYLCNNFTQVLRVKQSVAFPKYVFAVLFYLHQNGTTKLLQNKTTGIRNLQVKRYMALDIPLPPLAAQRQIAAVLDRASALIEKRKAQIEKLDLLIKSQFIEMFGDPVTNPKGWKRKSVTEVCANILGGGTPSKSHPEYFIGTIPCVSPKDMKSSVIKDSIDHINDDAVENSTTNLVPTNSVLMVIRSGILKRYLPVAINAVPVTINQDMKAFIPNNSVTPQYLMYYFKAIELDVLSGVRAVTADNIDFNHFKKRRIIVPSISFQNQFADFVRQVEIQKSLLKHSLAKLELNYKSLMQKCFRGELF